MRSTTLLAILGTALTASAVGACGGDVQATGCFQHRDLEETGRIGLELNNQCETRGYCTIKVAYDCGGEPQPVITQQFEIAPLGQAVEWVEIDCTAGWTYIKRWLCTEDDYPEIPDPSL